MFETTAGDLNPAKVAVRDAAIKEFPAVFGAWASAMFRL